MQDNKYIEINNCTINHLIIESGNVDLSNVNIHHLNLKYDSNVCFGDNCIINNITQE